MIEITNDTRQFLLNNSEVGSLIRDFEKAFIKLDPEHGGQYSLTHIEKRYPALAGMFSALARRKA